MRENTPKSCQSPLPNREKVDTSTMSFVAEVLDALMIILSWMDKPPFEHFNITKMINVGIELATNAQRDTFAENPMEVIKNCCQCLADLSDTLIQIDSSRESLILQPASLDQVTIEKRPGHDDFGLVIGKKHALKIYNQFALNTSWFYPLVLPQLCNFTKFLIQK